MSDKRLLTNLAAFLLVNLLIVIFLRGTISTVAGSYDDIPSSTIWFSLPHAGILYVLTPLVITAAIIILLAPGLLVVMAGQWATNPGELLLKGFGISFVLHFMNSALALIISDGALNPALFITLLSATLAGTFGYLILRAQQSSGIFGILSDHNNHGLYYTLLAIPFIFVVPLLPVLFWQDLNADGFEAMEMGRSLAFTLLPVFPDPAGTMGLGNGKLPMAYPIHWFIMLFGPTEASTRLPLILYTLVVYAALTSCIEYQSPRRMRWYEQAGLLLGIACYIVATSFNSGYDDYFSDISSPAAFDTLNILLIIGSVYFLWVGESRWFLFFTVLGFLARPTSLLIVVLMGAGIWIAAPERRRSSLVLIGTTIGIWVALLIGYEHLLLPSLSDGLGTPYSSASIIGRYQHLTFTDLHRFLYAAAPTGILPVLALLAYRWQDPFSRCLSIVTAGYFLAFYFPAFVSLHHFVPVMILPLIVLWRLTLSRADNVRPTLVTAGVTAAMLWLSLPQHFEINRIFRDIGSRTAYLIGDYQRDFSAYRQSMQGTSLIDSFFPYEWNIKDPARELVGGYQLIYYANTSGQPAANTNYLMLPAGSVPPDGYTLLKSDARGSAWVRDRMRWDADRYQPATTEYRSWLYEISRETSFYFTGIPARNYDIDLGSLPLLWRIFPGY